MLVLAVTNAPTNTSGGPQDTVIGVVVAVVVVLVLAAVLYQRSRRR